LDLKVSGEELDDPRELGQAQDAFGGDVADMRDAMERHEVVLAQRMERDVAGEDELVVPFVVRERGEVEWLGSQEFGEGSGDSTRRVGGDRLVGKGFIRRATSRQSGREITLTVTPAGRALVRAVTARRRREVNRIVERLPRDDRIRLRAALDTFARAAGEMALPDDAWKLGCTP
jgi:hypothetical protein